MLVLTLATAMVTGSMTEQSVADQFGAGVVAGAIIGGILGGMMHGQRQHNTVRRVPDKASDSGKDASSSGKPKKGDKNLDAALAALSQCGTCDVVLAQASTKSIFTKAGETGQSALGLTNRADEDREIDSALDDFIMAIKPDQSAPTLQASGKSGATTAAQPVQAGDVSLYAIKQTMDGVYDKFKLNQFEAFKDEGWTQDRLKVGLIHLAKLDVADVKDGNTMNRVMMSDVERMITNAARMVFIRTFETTESLAMNQRLEDFGRAVLEDGGSENYVPADPNEVVADAERLVDQVDTGHVLGQSKALAVGVRFRAERVALECFTRVYKARLDEAPAGGAQADPAPQGATQADKMPQSDAQADGSRGVGRPAPDADATARTDAGKPDQTAAASDPLLDDDPVSVPSAPKPAAYVPAAAAGKTVSKSDANPCRQALGNLLKAPDLLRKPVPRSAEWVGDHWDGDVALAASGN
jgi:hypothetical protein